jgi:hypothetical protein
MDDVVRLGGERRRPGWSRLAVATAALGLAAAGILSHLPSRDHAHTRPPASSHAVSSDRGGRGGPVQLAGLGGRAARLLNHSAGGHARSPTIGG